MPILTIGGKEVEVGDGFRAMPPDEQQAMVEHIAKSIGAEAPPPVWSGSILPFSKDAAGNVSVDSNAGLVGMAKRAVTAPGEVLRGETPTHLPNGQPNPELLRRAFDAAALGTPMSAASRAGAGWAGVPRGERQTLVPPTAQALKDAAGEGYAAARASGVDINSGAVADMARGLQSGLEQDGIIADLAPKTFAILGKITDPPEGSLATVANLEAIRRSFGEALRSSVGPDHATDRKAAGDAIRAVDKLLENLGPSSVVAGTATPEGAAAVASTLRDARGNYAAAQRSNDLTGVLDRAVTGITERAENRAQATNSGRNFDNALRQRVASMLERPKEVMGYSDAEIAALNEVLQGGRVRNFSREWGNRLGGGGGVGQSFTAGLAGAGAVAAGAGDLKTGMIAASPLVVGSSLKVLENALARRSMRKADTVVRQNSPLSREAQAQAPTRPGVSARDMAVLRALLPGLISPQQPPPRAFGGLGVI